MALKSSMACERSNALRMASGLLLPDELTARTRAFLMFWYSMNVGTTRITTSDVKPMTMQISSKLTRVRPRWRRETEREAFMM